MQCQPTPDLWHQHLQVDKAPGDTHDSGHSPL